MSRNRNPWVKLHIREWLDSERIMSMSCAAEGVYFRCLIEQASRGNLPANVALLARVINKPYDEVYAVWDEVSPHFSSEVVEGEDRIFNEKMRGIISDDADKSNNYSKAQKRRRRGESKTNLTQTCDKPEIKDRQTPSYSLSLSYSNSLDDFNTFWEHYPRYRRDKKKACLALWQKIVKTPELGAKIIAHVKDRILKDPNWRDNNGQFAVGPQVFLNGDGWEDDYSARATAKPAGPKTYSPTDREGFIKYNPETAKPMTEEQRIAHQKMMEGVNY